NRTYAKIFGAGRRAAAAPSRTTSADRRAYSGVTQLSSTPSATSPASRHIFGPSAATTTRVSSVRRSSATPSRTRASEPGLGLPTPRSRRSSGRAFARTPAAMLSGPRVWSGMTPPPSSIRRVPFAPSPSAASPSVAPGWLTQNELYPSASASRAEARMMSAVTPAKTANPSAMLGGLHAVEAERLEQRHVLEREEDRGPRARVCVLVRGARRHREEIALAPVVCDAIDDGASAAAHHVVDGARRLAMGAG